MSASRPVTPVPASSVSRYDAETDVLVVGFGCAGAAAAFEAASAGAEVLVLERAGGPGGSSALSGGELYLGGGTPVQTACGFQDAADDMFAYLKSALGPHADEEKLRVYCDESTGHFQWFVDRGLTFEKSLWDAPTWMPLSKDGLMWLGENAWPYNTVARPAPRGHRCATESYGGWLIMEKLVEAAGAAGALTHTDTLATALIVDEDGRVVGVTARSYGEERAYRARKGFTTVGPAHRFGEHGHDGVIGAMSCGYARRGVGNVLGAIWDAGCGVSSRGPRVTSEMVRGLPVASGHTHMARS
ncbi:FAD-dependent oxidoreductase [Streptomyces sp. NBC_01320]|uniref:FAD-dependent oxidoreductase n=1 Tax=Streptomyces sp. NBC_01320 TaxID=2903824 RepID=UPI002E12B3F8|nr:FAD-dependent oxidoreductase [Streptomyces sp. NBC_01320]